MLSPNDLNFVSNITFGDLFSDHALVKCCLDFACPALPKVGNISYCRYHKIDMQKFCDDLANISFAFSTASTAADFYDQYVHDLGYLLDRHAPFDLWQSKERTSWLVVRYISQGQIN